MVCHIEVLYVMILLYINTFYPVMLAEDSISRRISLAHAFSTLSSKIVYSTLRLSTLRKIFSFICRSNYWENVFYCLSNVLYSESICSNCVAIISLTYISRSIYSSSLSIFFLFSCTALIYSASSTHAWSIVQIFMTSPGGRGGTEPP